VDSIVKLLKEKGPLTGKELLDKCQVDSLLLWRACNFSGEITSKITGRRYLRLDRRVDGYARLSPSILREFLTYTVVGLKNGYSKIDGRARDLSENIRNISRHKLELSKEIIFKLACSQKSYAEIKEKVVFIIAGDIVYNMAHDELRPEPSTGEMVRGSDLDIVIITKDLPGDIVAELDRSIYKEKYYLLKNPAYREELDYIIKDMRRVEEQMDFNSFEHMVASKILDEGIFIYGNMILFKNVKEMLSQNKIPEKLRKMEEAAIIKRQDAVSYLLNNSGTLKQDEYRNLFYTKEETEEIF